MTVIKPTNFRLLLEDLLEIVIINFTLHKVNISYTIPENNFNSAEYDSIGFVEITDMEYLKEFLDYINENNAAALIFLGDRDVSLPLHITNQLCCVYEGLFKNVNKKDSKSNLQEILLRLHEKPLDNIENCDNLFKLLVTTLNYEDLLIYMNIDGQFKIVKANMGFIHKKINYFIPKTYCKPSRPIEITSDLENTTYSYFSEGYDY